jgi:hypothetical protein
VNSMEIEEEKIYLCRIPSEKNKKEKNKRGKC